MSSGQIWESGSDIHGQDGYRRGYGTSGSIVGSLEPANCKLACIGKLKGDGDAQKDPEEPTGLVPECKSTSIRD